MIAIIAILASMLLPALSRARAAAQAIKCTNNLKQDILGITMYTLNDNSLLPNAANAGLPGTEGIFAFYIVGAEIGGLPSADYSDASAIATTFISAIGNSNDVPPILYCPTGKRLPSDLSSVGGANFEGVGYLYNSNASLLSMTAIKNPSKFVIFCDSNGRTMADDANESQDFVHNNYANYGFADGHVDKYKANADAVSFTND